jgi:hypothetical protein
MTLTTPNIPIPVHGGLVAFRAVARSVGTSRPVVERVASDLGIPAQTFRASNGKVTLGVPSEDVERLLEALDSLRDRSLPLGGSEVPSALLGSRASVIYVVVLDPDCRPSRVKVGVTDSLTTRLADFRTTCPECQVLRDTPAPRSCEGYALALASALGTRVGTEVFDFVTPERLSAFVTLLDAALLPLSESVD